MNNRIFSIIGWIGTAFVVAALVIWGLSLTSYALPPRFDQYRFYMALAGLVCMLLYMVSQYQELGRLFSRRQARYGTLAASSVIVVLGILVAINYIGKQQNKRWDLTSAKQFSLSDQTRNVLVKLDAPLHLMVFVQEQEFPPYQEAGPAIAAKALEWLHDPAAFAAVRQELVDLKNQVARPGACRRP